VNVVADKHLPQADGTIVDVPAGSVELDIEEAKVEDPGSDTSFPKYGEFRTLPNAGRVGTSA
jgi:hypothetical protein